MKAPRLFAVGLVIGVLSMGGAARTAPPPDSGVSRGVTFSRDVLPILQRNCQSCHRPGQIGPMSLLTYRDARPWARAVKTAVVARAMPPWLADRQYGHFNNDRSLAQADIDTIAAWADTGAAEGDPAEAPPPVHWPDGGWQIQPDVVVDLPLHDVPPTGVLEWENLALPAPFKEDTWVTSVEILPGEPSVVHHMCFDIEKHQPKTKYNLYEWVERPRDDEGVLVKSSAPSREGTVVTREVGSSVESRHQGRPILTAGNEFCYLPGLPFEDYRPVNAGMFVPAGSDLKLTIHYTATGLGLVDRSRIGFTVARTAPAKRFLPQSGDDTEGAPVRRKSGINDLAIPPGEGNYAAPLSEVTFLRDVELVWLRPHAHVRATRARYTLKYPDGREEIVLNVPRYDFNWQLTYRTDLKIPKGSVMRVEFWYDNSAANKYNPDPTKWVYYGDQSWEEMGTPNMGFLVDRDAQ